MKVPVVVKEVSPKVKQVGPRRRVVHLRIERECYSVLQERAFALGCPLDDLLDAYLHILAYGTFVLSADHPLMIKDFDFSSLFSNCKCSAAPSEEVSENG